MLIFDCDPGIDDAIALLLAGSKFDLITTTCGNVSAEMTFLNARIIVGYLGMRTSVARGEGKPLSGEPYFVEKVHGRDGLGGVQEKYVHFAYKSKDLNSADAIKESTGAEILATGPLTNIGKALKEMPSLRIRRIVWMGGAFFVPGNVSSWAEFNAYFDPWAVREVLKAQTDLTIVPLDVTTKTYIRREKMLKLIKSKKLREFIRDITRDLKGVFLHDPLACLYFFRNDILKTVRANVQIDTEAFRGRMTATFSPKGRVKIAYDVNLEKFFETIVEFSEGKDYHQ